MVCYSPVPVIRSGKVCAHHATLCSQGSPTLRASHSHSPSALPAYRSCQLPAGTGRLGDWEDRCSGLSRLVQAADCLFLGCRSLSVLLHTYLFACACGLGSQPGLPAAKLHEWPGPPGIHCLISNRTHTTQRCKSLLVASTHSSSKVVCWIPARPSLRRAPPPSDAEWATRLRLATHIHQHPMKQTSFQGRIPGRSGLALFPSLIL